MKKALLLGAGFSYELGLPLASNLTDDLYAYLNIRRLNTLLSVLSVQQPYGLDRPIDANTFKEIREIFLHAMLQKTNFEELMTIYLNAANHRDQPVIDTFNYFNTVLVDIVSQILWLHQEKKYDIFLKNSQFYQLIKQYLNDGEDVFVFTLNHDICFEMLCIDNDIPFSFGTNTTISYGRSNIKAEDKISFLLQSRIDYFASSFHDDIKPKFNIVKLHGAFNEFAKDDERNLLFVDFNNCKTSNDYFERVKTAWNDTEYIINGKNVKMSEFIPVTDDKGEFQILEKSLRIGGNKYSNTINPKPGEEKIQIFENVLNQVDELTIIGYGFNDKHINNRIYSSMILNKNLKIKKVDPSNTKYPEYFDALNYGLRLTGGQCTATQWLYYRLFNQWDYDKNGVIKEYNDKRSELDKVFRKKYFTK
jgi:hypothetical protein